MSFRLQLDNLFHGPLDLLLYLVKKHELDIVDISVSKITEQFLEYLIVLEHLDINGASDFLDVASMLLEIKSKLVLPHLNEMTEAEVEDPHQELVERLLQYKEYRDAAKRLEEQAQAWQERYPRLENDLPNRQKNPAEQPISEVEIWDLVSAFSRVIKEKAPAPTKTTILYDDTPIYVFMEKIHARILQEKEIFFSQLFEEMVHKSTMVGMFLAVLELVRHRHAHAVQNQIFGDIALSAGENLLPKNGSNFTDYEKTSLKPDEKTSSAA